MSRRIALVFALFGAIAILITATSVGTHTNERPSAPPDTAIALGSSAVPDATHRVPAHCLDTASVPTVSAIDLVWSPDGSAIAYTATDGGRERIGIVRIASATTAMLADGSGPRWSASGSRIAFARGSSIAIIDATSGKDVGTISAAAPGYGWSGDTLLYWDGTRLRGWSDGRTGTVSAHIPDSTPLKGDVRLSVSADGTRYALASATKVMYGETRDGRLSLLSRATAIKWSTFGANALLDYATGERGFLASTKLVFGAQALPPAFALWSPDGSQALLGPEPTGPMWDLIGWAGTKNGDATRIPSALRQAAFAPTGAHVAGITGGELRVMRCGDDASTARYISRAQAQQLIDRTGDLLKVNISDSKLVRWGDIAGILTGDWAARDAPADKMAPTDLVWLMRYAGEARTPSGVKWDQPTVNLILYVLDARDGTRLARRIANGTWWIGEPFESVVDRAPDPTSHPFEAPPGATNPIQMPSPPPTPTLATSATRTGFVQAESAGGGWSVEYPDGWWPSRDGYAGATLSTRDPASGRGGTVALPGAYDWGATLNIQLWPNADKLDPDGFADRRFAGNMVETVQSRKTITIAGQRATTLLLRDGPNPPDNSFTLKRIWIVATPVPDRMLVVTGSSADSDYAPEFDSVVASLALTTPRTRTDKPDITRQQVLDRWASPKNPPARIEAKLVTFAEASATDASGAYNPLRRDPNGLVWIVALSDPTGTLIPTRGPFGTSSRAARWQVYVTPAYSDDLDAGLWGQTGFEGDWPPFFDALQDRCC